MSSAFVRSFVCIKRRALGPCSLLSLSVPQCGCVHAKLVLCPPEYILPSLIVNILVETVFRHSGALCNWFCVVVRTRVPTPASLTLKHGSLIPPRLLPAFKARRCIAEILRPPSASPIGRDPLNVQCRTMRRLKRIAVELLGLGLRSNSTKQQKQLACMPEGTRQQTFFPPHLCKTARPVAFQTCAR